MLIPIADVIRCNRITITGVVHVGAHRCEEAEAYQAAGITDVTWIEGDPELIPSCQIRARKFRHSVIEAVVTDIDHGQTTFHRTNNFQSSSVLPLGTHIEASPDVHYVGDVTLGTRTLDSLASEHGLTGNMINSDTQGMDLAVLQGAREFLRGVDLVYAEFSTDELYVGCGRLWEMDDYLTGCGFIRTDTKMAGPVGWGDAAWVSRRLMRDA